MSIKLVVFDFDGTLVDTRKILLGIVKKNVEKRGFKLEPQLRLTLKRKSILLGKETSAGVVAYNWNWE